MAFDKVIDIGAEGGSVFGKSATTAIGFYGVTPIAQRAGASQIALTTALASVTATGGYAFALSTGFSSFLALVEEMRATMVALGLMKGAA